MDEWFNDDFFMTCFCTGFFHEQSFCPKGSVGISSINAGEQAELSWPNYAFNWIASFCPSKKISTGKKANKKLYTIYTFTGMTSFPICANEFYLHENEKSFPYQRLSS